MDHLSAQQIQDYSRRAPDARELLLSDDHLQSCAYCRRQLRNATRAPALPSLLEECGENLHLSYEQMTAFMDGLLQPDRRESVENHASLCSRCSRELEELRQFDARLSLDLQSAQAKPAVAKAPFWQRVAARFQVPRFNWSYASALALMLVGTIGVVSFVWQGSNSRITNMISGNQTAPAALTHHALLYGSGVLLVVGAGYLLMKISKK